MYLLLWIPSFIKMQRAKCSDSWFRTVEILDDFWYLLQTEEDITALPNTFLFCSFYLKGLCLCSDSLCINCIIEADRSQQQSFLSKQLLKDFHWLQQNKQKVKEAMKRGTFSTYSVQRCALPSGWSVPVELDLEHGAFPANSLLLKQQCFSAPALKKDWGTLEWDALLGSLALGHRTLSQDMQVHCWMMHFHG